MKRFSQDPTDPAFVQNPYAFYEKTRSAGPVFFWEEYAMPCVTGFTEVDALLRDRGFGRENPPEFRTPHPPHLDAFHDFESRSMLELEPPAHSRLRGLVIRAFTSRRIAAMDREIEALCHQLIDGFPDGPFDLLNAYAEKIPVIVIARLLGVPETMSGRLLDWSHAMVAMYEARRTRAIEDRAVRATEEFSAFMRGHIEKRRVDPRDDLITTLIAVVDDGARLSTDEMITTLILLLNAGHEATVHAIGNAVKMLLETGHPTAALKEPAQCDRIIEESLRLDPPLHMFTRFAYHDVAIAGHDIKRGDEIGLLLAAANRDPARFDAANRFDPDRPDQAHTSFGAGVHFCLGAPLARLEMKAALPILFARCPSMQLARQPDFADRYHFHGLAGLTVTTRAAARSPPA